MRLARIMENKPTSRKYYWKLIMGITGFGACALGLMSSTALAKTGSEKNAEEKIIYQKRVPPMMPAKCVGLNSDEIGLESRKMTVKGEAVGTLVAEVGSVVLGFDVRMNGDVHNIKVVKSNHSCFEANAKAALAQWKIEPQGEPLNDIRIEQVFLLTGETHKELETALDAFVQN